MPVSCVLHPASCIRIHHSSTPNAVTPVSCILGLASRLPVSPSARGPVCPWARLPVGPVCRLARDTRSKTQDSWKRNKHPDAGFLRLASCILHPYPPLHHSSTPNAVTPVSCILGLASRLPVSPSARGPVCPWARLPVGPVCRLARDTRSKTQDSGKRNKHPDAGFLRLASCILHPYPPLHHSSTPNAVTPVSCILGLASRLPVSPSARGPVCSWARLPVGPVCRCAGYPEIQDPRLRIQGKEINIRMPVSCVLHPASCIRIHHSTTPVLRMP